MDEPEGVRVADIDGDTDCDGDPDRVVDMEADCEGEPERLRVCDLLPDPPCEDDPDADAVPDWLGVLLRDGVAEEVKLDVLLTLDDCVWLGEPELLGLCVWDGVAEEEGVELRVVVTLPELVAEGDWLWLRDPVWLPLLVDDGVNDWLGVGDVDHVPDPDAVCVTEAVADSLAETVADGLCVPVMVPS